MIELTYYAVAGFILLWGAGSVWLVFSSPRESALRKERHERWESAKEARVNIRPFGYYPSDPEKHLTTTSIPLGTPPEN